MLPVYLGIYVFVLLMVWGFFFVARHHSYKFKHFSTHIGPVTNILFLLLIILSIGGFIMIFNLEDIGREVRIDTQERISETYY